MTTIEANPFLKKFSAASIPMHYDSINNLFVIDTGYGKDGLEKLKLFNNAVRELLPDENINITGVTARDTWAKKLSTTLTNAGFEIKNDDFDLLPYAKFMHFYPNKYGSKFIFDATKAAEQDQAKIAAKKLCMLIGSTRTTLKLERYAEWQGQYADTIAKTCSDLGLKYNIATQNRFRS